VTSVVCFGELLLRLSPPGFERLFQSPLLHARFGGSEANVAIALARFGVSTAYVTRLPGNAIGDAGIRMLRGEGVDTGHVVRGGDRLGIYFVETGAGQRPSSVIYDRAPSAFSTLSAAEIEWPRVLRDASWLHLTGITPALGPGPLQSAAAAMAAARQAGIAVSFDLNYRATLWPADTAASALQPFAQGADVLIASEDHLQPLLDITPGPGAPQRVAERYGSRLVAITARDNRSASDNAVSAALWVRETGELCVAPRYDLQIVDRIGAGDAFAAGLIYALSGRRSPGDALRFAVAAGALKHTIPGDAALLTVAEVDRVANGDVSGRVQR
jgi:2-dehydro-3-deoxygluconokinase